MAKIKFYVDGFVETEITKVQVDFPPSKACKELDVSNIPAEEIAEKLNSGEWKIPNKYSVILGPEHFDIHSFEVVKPIR